jgi:hypothetical protein
MFQKPDYKNLRRQYPFRWYIAAPQSELLELAKIPIRDFNMNADAGIKAYRCGRPLEKKMFGEELYFWPICTPWIKYGHVNALGCELEFPQGGHVHSRSLFSSVEEGIEYLEKPVDFEAAGMVPFYLEYRQRLQKAFPNEDINFGFLWEGPVTTAWLMLQDSFMYDVYDKMDLLKEFMTLSTDSIIQYCRFHAKVTGHKPNLKPDDGFLCDDIAAMIPDYLFEELVLPFWEQYYSGLEIEQRCLHCEGLRPEQLKYLDEIGISVFDPSISPKLNPKIISSECNVPFGWRLASFQYVQMTCRDVEDFVFQSVADGASYVFTAIEEIMCNEADAEKVHTFRRAAKEAERMLGQGISRKEIGQKVSTADRSNFWRRWAH